MRPLLLCAACDQSVTVSGSVVEAGVPVSDVTVRIQTKDNAATTDSRGLFSLLGMTPGAAVTVSAWKDGYYCAQVEHVTPPARNIRISLTRYQNRQIHNLCFQNSEKNRSLYFIS